MARVLAPGGRVVIGDFTNDAIVTKGADLVLQRVERGHVGLHRLDELRRLLEDAGLEGVEGRSLYHGIFGLALARKPG